MSHATLVPSTAPTRVDDLTFTIHTTPFDEDYTPAASTRATTNFANLARGADRRENLRAALAMIDGRLNDLAPWDNPERDRYTARIEIVSIDVHFTADDGVDVDTDDDIDPSSDEDIGSLASTVDYDSDVWSTEDISDVEIQSLSRDLLEFPSQMAGEEALEIFNRLLEE